MGTYRAQSFAGLPQDWLCRGYRGAGRVEDLFDSLLGRTALVVGSGGQIDEIINDVERYGEGAVVFAANDIGMYLRKVDHFVSLHSDKLKHWAGVRRDGSSKPIHPEFKTHTARDTAGIDYCWGGLTPLFPLSGYFAMQIAWIMGADKIILIGCPGDSTKRFFDAKPKVGERYSEMGIRDQVQNEMRRLSNFKSAVRSTSGWTEYFFGRP